MSDFSNPFHSTLVSLKLSNIDGSESIDIMQKNSECEFHRIELESSIFDVFPSGTLIVRQKKDLITRLVNFKIDYIEFIQENGSKVNFRIHSVSNLNNAASANEEAFIAIHFTNYLYHPAQEKTLTTILNKVKPKVYRIDKFVKVLQESLGKEITNGVGKIDATDNYVCYRPLNPKNDNTDVASDSFVEYLNYLSSLAVPYQQGPYSGLGLIPRFLFWTDWDSNINFKVIAPLSFELKKEQEITVNKYAIYSGDTSVRKINGIDWKKIYNYHTNQGAQFITKSYYYVRKTPKILDIHTNPFLPAGNTYFNMAYQFWSEGEKHNVELICSKQNVNGEGEEGGINLLISGAEELVYPGEWGYQNDAKSNDISSNSVYSDNRYNFEKRDRWYLGSADNTYLTTNFSYIDNPEMWKNMFDLTPIDPYYPLVVDSIEDPATCNLQKVIDIRYAALDGTTPAPNLKQQELVQKIEKYNFIAYSLCCTGDSGEDESFYAVLTKYRSAASVAEFGGATKTYLYEWKKIVFGGGIPSNPNSFEASIRKFGSGSWQPSTDEASGDYTQNSENWKKLAINLNEAGNNGPLTNILAPGWAPESSSQPNIKYRPVGARGTSPDTNSGDIYHVVKLYKTSYAKLLNKYGSQTREQIDAFFLANPTLAGNSVYYFTVENVVDGTCS